MTNTAPTCPQDCPSQLALDRLFAGECNDLEKARILRQLAGCAVCTEALETRRAERESFVPDPVLLARLTALSDGATSAQRSGSGGPSQATPRRWRRLASAALALACSVALLGLLARPRAQEQPLDRLATSKGGDVAELFVLRRNALAPVADGGQLHPGDQLQVVLRVKAPRFVALYSRDGAGTVTRYAPTDSVMVQVIPGGEAILPNSTVLDEVLGREILTMFFCEEPQQDALLRSHVEAGQPTGCEVTRLRLAKVIP